MARSCQVEEDAKYSATVAALANPFVLMSKWVLLPSKK
jgi:hypothetical protein